MKLLLLVTLSLLFCIAQVSLLIYWFRSSIKKPTRHFLFVFWASLTAIFLIGLPAIFIYETDREQKNLFVSMDLLILAVSIILTKYYYRRYWLNRTRRFRRQPI